MQDLAKLTIEELENILAIAPYSQLHQMMYSIKKNEKEKGALYQYQEGALLALENEQQEFSEKIIQQLSEDEKPEDKVSDVVVDEVISSEKENTTVLQLRSSVPGTEGEEDTPLDLPLTDKKSDKKKPKKKKEAEKKETKQKKKSTKKKSKKEKPRKPKKGKKKLKKKKEKEPTKVKPEKTKKKKKEKSNKKKKIKSKLESPKSKSKKSKKSKSKKNKKDITLSDFSQWLLTQSKENTMTDFSYPKFQKKTTKKKNKRKKKDKSIISEPLANLLAKQGHNDEAKEMYEQLSLIFPEKSAFFAAKIEKLKKD